jgi:hypothetical protein
LVNLAVDALQEAVNFEVLRELTCLRILHVGVFLGTPSGLLSYPSLHHLERLVLGGGRYSRLALDHLAGYQALTDLHVTGYTKGIERLAEVKCLKRLSLSGIENR